MKRIKKAILFALLVCINITLLSAQTKGIIEVRGEVKNSNGEPLSIANVVALSQTDSTYIAGVTTDENGCFHLNTIPNGSLISISLVGYQRICVPAKEHISVMLKEDEVVLKELEVVSSYARRSRSGSLVVNFKGNPITNGKNLLEALRLIQGVEVIADNILVNGKEGTLVYLGSRKISMDEFKTIPTTAIKSVEVISNPGVAYGKEAVGGVIKVTLRDTEGLLGSITLSNQADKEGFVDVTGSPYLLYRKGKFTVYNSLLAGYGNYRTYYNRTDNRDGKEAVKNSVQEINKDYGFMDNLGFRCDFNQRHSIDIYGGVYYDQRRNTYDNYIKDRTTLSMRTNSKTLNLNAGALYKMALNIASESSFTLKTEYANMSNNSLTKYTLGQTDDIRLRQQMTMVTAEPKITMAFDNFINLEAGFLYDYLRDDNKMSGTTNPYLAQLKEQSYSLWGGDYAPWVEYSMMVGQGFYFQLGLRYQHSHVHYDDRLNPEANYTVINKGLYPRANLQILIDSAKMMFLELAYNRSFSLPNYGYYSPLPVYQTDYLYSIGNQKLRQETFNTGEVIYHFNPQWMMGYRVKSGSDLIHILTHQDTTHPKTIYTKPENVGKMLEHQLFLSYTGSPLKKWYSNNRIYLNKRQESMPERSIKSNSIGFSSTQQVSVSDNIGITLSLSGGSPQKTLAYETNFNYSLDFGAYMSFYNNNLVVNLGVNNLLHSNNLIRIRSDFAQLDRTDISPRRRLKLSVTWNFSTGDKIKRQRTSMIQALSTKAPVL